MRATTQERPCFPGGKRQESQARRFRRYGYEDFRPSTWCFGERVCDESISNERRAGGVTGNKGPTRSGSDNRVEQFNSKTFGEIEQERSLERVPAWSGI